MPYHLDRKSTRLNSSHGSISYAPSLDRKSTRLNSSHGSISYAVFCLKKKKTRVPSSASPASRRPAIYLPPPPTVSRGVVAASLCVRQGPHSPGPFFFFFF